METKYIILCVLLGAGIAVWLLPKAQFSKRLRLSERAYRIIHWIGLVSAIAGTIVSVLFPGAILKEHLYELFLLPVVAAYAVYPTIIARATRSTELYDEKQIWDTTRAAALSLGATTMSMFVVYAYYNEDVLGGTIWFPLLMFNVVGWYSAGTLYFHRTG